MKAKSYILTDLLIIIGIFLLISVVAFPQYLFLKKVFYFNDIGSDTWNLFFPNLVHDQYIAKQKTLTWWSFHKGLGTPFAPKLFLEPSTLIFYLVPKSYIYSFHLFYFTDLLLIAIFMYLYLKELKLNRIVRLIGAIYWAFSGYIMIATTWYVYPRIFLGFTILLFGLERAINKSKTNFWIFYGFYLLSYNIYYTIIWGGFLLLYFIFRLYQKQKLKTIYNYAWKIALLAGLAIFLASLTMSTLWHAMFTSPRSNIITNLHYMILRPFKKASISLYTTLLLRLFGTDTAGSAIDFKGWWNYLEAPIFYIGILTLLFIPKYLRNNSQKIHKLIIGVSILSVLVPLFMQIINLFTLKYYRPNIDLFFSFILFYYGINGLNLYFQEPKIEKRDKIWWGILFSTLLLVSLFTRNIHVFNIIALILLLIYFVLLQTKYSFLLPAIVIIEVVLLSAPSFYNRAAFSYQDLTENLLVYKNNNLYKAIEKIKALDTTKFYRIQQNIKNNFPNSSQVLRYFGTYVYQSFIPKSTIDFYKSFGIIGKSIRWRKLNYGIPKNPELASILAIKYFITDTNAQINFPPYFDTVVVIDDLTVIKNNNFLTLAYFYPSLNFYPYEKFFSLEYSQKVKTIYQQPIISREAVKFYPKLSEKIDTNQQVTKIENKILKFSNDDIHLKVFIPNPGILVFSIPYDKNWLIFVNGKLVPTIQTNIGFTAIAFYESGKYFIHLKYVPYYLKIYYSLKTEI